MKKSLLRMLLLMAFAVITSVPVAAQVKSVTNATADTYVRKANTSSYGTATTMEIKTYKNDTNDQDFVGLMTFVFTPVNKDSVVKSATLRLTTERIKGDAYMNIYAFKGDFTENSKYADLETSVADARANDSITRFKLAGEWNKSIVSDAVSADFVTVDKWTNTIDLSGYVKTMTTNKLSIMITRSTNENNSNKIFTREAASFTNSKDATISFAAADIVPQLTVVYEKSESTGVSTITSESAKAVHKGIYTLQGLHLSDISQSGIYIVDGKKMVVRK